MTVENPFRDEHEKPPATISRRLPTPKKIDAATLGLVEKEHPGGRARLVLSEVLLIDIEVLRHEIYGGILDTLTEDYSHGSISNLLLILGEKYETWWRKCLIVGDKILFHSNSEYSQEKLMLIRQVARELAKKGHSVIARSYEIDEKECVREYDCGCSELRASGLEMIGVARRIDSTISKIRIESIPRD